MSLSRSARPKVPALIDWNLQYCIYISTISCDILALFGSNDIPYHQATALVASHQDVYRDVLQPKGHPIRPRLMVFHLAILLPVAMVVQDPNRYPRLDVSHDRSIRTGDPRAGGEAVLVQESHGGVKGATVI
jgi:hypothetical protein